MSSDMGSVTRAETLDHVVATYREIAVRLGFGGPNAARTKAKRPGWAVEPSNHPADPLRVRVPRDAWYQAIETSSSKSNEPRVISSREAASQSGHLKTLERERRRA